MSKGQVEVAHVPAAPDDPAPAPAWRIARPEFTIFEDSLLPRHPPLEGPGPAKVRKGLRRGKEGCPDQARHPVHASPMARKAEVWVEQRASAGKE